MISTPASLLPDTPAAKTHADRIVRDLLDQGLIAHLDVAGVRTP